MQQHERITHFNAGEIDRARPPERPPKTNKKTEFIKKMLRITQYPAPKWTANKIWAEFTRPGRVRWRDNQEELAKSATITPFTYRGHTLNHYRWGVENQGPKALLVHGWRSKAVDFRRMILILLELGYTVDGIDMKAHGKSEGRHTALPEFYEVLQQKATQTGPYDLMVGYSLGGLATGLFASHLPKEERPKQLFLFAAPTYPRYFFQDIIDELKLGKRVYRAFTHMVGAIYNKPIDWWDLRINTDALNSMDVHLLYDEHDETVSMEKGKELFDLLPQANFFQGRGLGHYKIISHEVVLGYLKEHVQTTALA